MQLGVISDIHGNRPALDAVLKDMPPIDSLVCLGDIVGYNPWPHECVEQVRDAADIILQGNHDRLVNDRDAFIGNEMAHEEIRYAHSQLSEEERD